MTLFEKALLAADFIGVVGFAGAFLLMLKYRFDVKDVRLFFVVFATVSLFEYYFLGQNSYIAMDDEGDHFVPYNSYLLNFHLGGQFGHHFAGGNDIYSAFSPSIQLVSPELIWLKLFPTWIAILIHKFIVLAVGFWGSYLLCRRTTTANVFVCAAVGAIFTVSTHNLIIVTYSIGSSLAFLPLAIYTFVARSKDDSYWRLMIPTGIATGIYLDITHSVELMFAGIGLSAILLDRINVRVCASLVLLFLIMIINWAEPIYAIAQMAAFTERAGDIKLYELSLDSLRAALSSLVLRASENRISLLALACVGLLWVQKDDLWKRAAVAIFGTFGIFIFVSSFPFQEIGLGMLSNLSHQYVLLAVTGVMLVPAACAATNLHQSAFWPFKTYSNAPGALMLALAIGMVLHFKVYNFSNLLYHGGQSQYHSIENLAKTGWKSETPLRAMTLRVRDIGPEPGLAYGLYGLDSLDVYQMLETKQRSVFNRFGIFKTEFRNVGTDPRLFVNWDQWQNGVYSGIGKQLSLKHLRLINAGYLFSPLPFAKDREYRLVSGPETPPLTKSDRSEDPARYMRDRLSRLIDFPELYIYAIANPYPQVFAATRKIVVPNAIDDVEYIDLLGRHVSDTGFIATVKDLDSGRMGEVKESLQVVNFERIRDGFDIQTRAPEGGIVVVNSVQLPFWSATADGKPVDILPVNYIQMGVQVPPGTKTVKFLYHRPSVADLIQKSLHLLN